MLATHSKIAQASALLGRLLSDEPVVFSDTRLFFRDFGDALQTPYYPEVAIGWRGEQPQLLGCTDYFLGYSLHESPIAEDSGHDDTNENPGPAADLVLELAQRYLHLYPHERTSFSTVLYNCDSARLPQAVVEKMDGLGEGENSLRCEVVLRHRDQRKLAELYEKIVESTSDGDALYAGSETSADFMARLRIAIMADQAPAPREEEGRPVDLVFLHDVIARHARIGWYEVARDQAAATGLCPATWSRRRPAAVDDMKSVVYLDAPVQTLTGWQYLSAVSSFFDSGQRCQPTACLLPARVLDFNEEATRIIFTETHNLGNWVANYDELLDRRQLQNQGVRVIRFKQTHSQGRNVLVSSKAPLGLLRSMVKQRIAALTPELALDQIDALATRFIADANAVSGDLALRAAKRGRSASELMGVVLSRYLVERELGPDGLRGWFFLDDYAEWLGQKEEHIADLMALNLQREGSGYRIGIIVTEAKYIDHGNLAAKRRESEKQLRDTVARMRRALFGEPPCLDRALWLTRLGNLIVNGIHLPANAPLTTTDWVKALREGRCELYVRGYSHVFVSGPSDCPDCSESRELEDPEDSFQEVFSRSDVKRVVHDYLAGTDPGPLRRELSDGVDRTAKTYTPVTDSGAPVPRPTKSGSSSTAPEGATGRRTPVPDGEGAESAANSSMPPTTGGAGGDGAGPHGVRAVLMSAAPPGAPEEASSRAWLLEMESACKGALQQFHLKSKLLESKLTPNCALLKFQGSSNLTVDQVQKRQTEFLTSYGLKIVAVRPEPGRVAISIARPERQVITVGDAWRGWAFEQAANPCRLPVAVREEDGELLFLSPLTNAPHTLVAGSTNSGKSVLMQNLMLAIGCASTPERSKITLIDPKGGVDYFAFVELPHLRQEMIVEMDGAVAALSALVEEMDERYRVLRDRQATNLAEFNAKAVPADRLPFLWLIHDEFAEWMMQEEYSANVTNLVSRLGVKARAAGIFLVFAAQRPDKDVMPMQLRSQLGNRLILRVDSEGTSELALGEKGAERLLGRGHLAARLEGEADTVYAQVPFADSATIQAAVKAIARQYSQPVPG